MVSALSRPTSVDRIIWKSWNDRHAIESIATDFLLADRGGSMALRSRRGILAANA